MKKVLPRVVFILLLLVGVALISYPTISNWLVEYNAISITQAYVANVNKMTEEEIEAEFQKAEEYNAALTGSGIEDPFVPESGIVLPDNYTSIFDFDYSVMGYIEIPTIDVFLPIYHGSSESVLQRGVGHMENTAFPIGGGGDHSVLTGHTGLPSAKLFTDLDKLVVGDTFLITILNRTIAYEVDKITVIEPDNTEDLRPVAGEDYVTLVTCTPYGINSHRLLVRGTRIPYSNDAETDSISQNLNDLFTAVVIAVSLILLIILIIVLRIRKNSSKNKNTGNQ